MPTMATESGSSSPLKKLIAMGAIMAPRMSSSIVPTTIFDFSATAISRLATTPMVFIAEYCMA